MTIESTNDNKPTTPAITYSECYQQCFCSDNLELMKTIESNTIDLIYCDILYGTGRKFKDYQDLKPIRSEIENHYIPRIKEMHRILKPTGSIYLQMDYRISHWLRIIMDDIFNYKNYVQSIYWKYNAGGKHKDKFKTVTDEILFYSKTENKYFYPERVMIPHHPDTYRRIKGYANAGITININGKQRENLWYINAVKKGNYIKRNDEWVDYATQKPKEIIEVIVKASSNEGDLVADFYLGSGTTAEVCKDLNRNFIGCDINPRAVEITLQRLNNARS
jgi:site-specific DNA-methyltransferase (adenine-specific)